MRRESGSWRNGREDDLPHLRIFLKINLSNKQINHMFIHKSYVFGLFWLTKCNSCLDSLGNPMQLHFSKLPKHPKTAQWCPKVFGPQQGALFISFIGSVICQDTPNLAIATAPGKSFSKSSQVFGKALSTWLHRLESEAA